MNSDWKVLVQVIRPGERYNSECLQPSVKHGGGSFMAQKPRNYEHRRVPSKHLIGNSFIFQHDNDPNTLFIIYSTNGSQTEQKLNTNILDCKSEASLKSPSVLNAP